MADITGLAVTEIMGLRLAAELAGSTQDTLNKGIKIFVRRLGESVTGAGEATKAFRTMGLSPSNLVQKGTLNALLEVIDNINLLGTISEKAAISFQIFGRQGVELANLFTAGAGFIRQAIQEAIDLGLGFTREDVAIFELMNDKWFRMGQLIQGVKIQFIRELAPAMSDQITKLITKFKEWREAGNTVEKSVQGILLKIDLLVPIAIKFASTILDLTKGFALFIKSAIPFLITLAKIQRAIQFNFKLVVRVVSRNLQLLTLIIKLLTIQIRFLFKQLNKIIPITKNLKTSIGFVARELGFIVEGPSSKTPFLDGVISSLELIESGTDKAIGALNGLQDTLSGISKTPVADAKAQKELDSLAPFFPQISLGTAAADIRWARTMKKRFEDAKKQQKQLLDLEKNRQNILSTKIEGSVVKVTNEYEKQNKLIEQMNRGLGQQVILARTSFASIVKPSAGPVKDQFRFVTKNQAALEAVQQKISQLRGSGGGIGAENVLAQLIKEQNDILLRIEADRQLVAQQARLA